MKRLFSVLFVGMGLLSCKDEPEMTKVAEEEIWQENSNFQFDRKNQYNSWSDGDNLYVLGRNEFTTVSTENGHLAYEHALLWLKYDLNHQMPITERIFVTANGSTVRFAPTRNPVLNHSDFFLQMRDIDPGFTAFDFAGFDFGEGIQIDEQYRVLIPYYASDAAESPYKLLLVQLEVATDEGSDHIDTLSTAVVPSLGPVISIHTYNEDFYVTHSQGTFRIDQQGSIHTISSRPFYKMFDVENMLFGIYDSEVYTSTDGLNWALVAENDNLRLLRYGQTGDFSLGYYNSQLFLFEREGDTIDIVELDNVGLEGHEITSVGIVDDQVFVTTLSGVFQKPLSKFDTPSIDEGGS